MMATLRVWVSNQPPTGRDETWAYLLAAVERGWQAPAGITLDPYSQVLSGSDRDALWNAFYNLAGFIRRNVTHGVDMAGNPIPGEPELTVDKGGAL